MTFPAGGKLLLVDDEPAVRKMLKMFLERRGLPVIDAASGEEALELLTSEKSSLKLLITDVTMPGMSGRELAEHAFRLNSSLPILFISGYSDSILELPEGVQCMPKPIDFKLLLAEIDRLVGPDPESQAA